MLRLKSIGMCACGAAVALFAGGCLSEEVKGGAGHSLGGGACTPSFAVPADCVAYTTLDERLQEEVARVLEDGRRACRAERGCAVVLSVKTGAVLALASAQDAAVPAAEAHPVVAEAYEPGSVMKVITACAVLNEGRHGPDSPIDTARDDPKYFRLPGDAGHRWEETMTVRDALVHSSNIVFGKLGYDLGPKLLWSYMDAFGLGRRTGVGLPGEVPGAVADYGKWDKVKWSRAPIGQGVSVTPIQLAAAYAAIGNDGELLRPYFVDRIVRSSDGEVVLRNAKTVVGRPVTPATARQVRDMMTGVAKEGGTARRAAVAGYSVACKTGTAQMQEGRGYSTTNFNASVAGLVPATRPEVAILVIYRKPFYCRSKATSEAEGVPVFNHQGGLCAAPVFRDIAQAAMRRLGVKPDEPETLPADADGKAP